MQLKTTRTPSAWPRYALSLVLLASIVGGIAWLAQYLPSNPKTITPTPPEPKNKDIILFAWYSAVWDNHDKKETEKERDKGAPLAVGTESEKKESYAYKDVEQGSNGHYDFLFKNVADQDVELISVTSDCDCTHLKGCALTGDERDHLFEAYKKAPASPLPYAKEPIWQVLPTSTKQSASGSASKLLVKAGGGGVVRVEWVAKKAPGLEMRLNPKVVFQAVGEPGLIVRHPLYLHVMVRLPFQFYPPRLDAGILAPGQTAAVEFDLWSSTRDALNIQFPLADPALEVEMKPLSKDGCARLDRYLVSKEIGTRVRTGYRVTVKIHETKDGKQLDHGSFFRKFLAAIDGFPTEHYGPEIVGRVQGDIQIGGASDNGKIRFKSFDARNGASRELQLSTDAKTVLEPFPQHPHQPSWIKVTLALDDKSKSAARRIWDLDVVVPPEARGARSFDEPDAVVLRIVGTDRLVRIPLEGHVGGR